MTEHALPAPPDWIRLTARLVPRLPAGRYRIARFLSRASSTPFWMALPPELGGYEFHCDLRDSVHREICFTGVYEPQETALVRAILRKRMRFVDVGAHCGYFTSLSAHLVGSGGRVVALEPDPRLCSRLQQAVERNALEHVEVLPVAAAERTDIRTLAGFLQTGDNWGVSRLSGDFASGRPRFDVQTRRLDDLMEERRLFPVDLVKLDVEGAEAEALRGMRRGLDEGRYHRLLLELHPTILREKGLEPATVLEPILQAGYRGWAIDHSRGATRRAAYTRRPDPCDFIRPFDPAERFDAWPHLLWAAPGVELFG